MSLPPVPALKAVVFDLDGTLVNSLEVTFEAFNQGFLSQQGRRHTPEEIMAYFGPGEDQIFSKIVGSERAQAAYACFQSYFETKLGAIPLYEGVLGTLQSARSRGLRVGLFTGRSWNTTEMILRHHGLLDAFDVLLANDHVARPKPAPDGIHLAAASLGLPPESIAYVGDSHVDVRSARSAGAISVAAIWDERANLEKLAQAEPHYWAKSLGEVERILLH